MQLYKIKKLTILVIILSFLIALSSWVLARDRYAKPREIMIERHLKGRDIKDEKVLKAMELTPRQEFVPKKFQNKAYADHPLPIGYGQTISQPYIVALMTQLLELKPGQRVLEIGTGSGYQAAVLTYFTGQVYTIEIIEPLAEQAKKRLKRLQYDQVEVKHADGYFGWKEHGPFDAIIVTCAANHIPSPLLSQLKVGGRLLIPLGSTTFFQTLTLITKTEEGNVVKHISGVAFVPMTGRAQEGP